MDVSKARWRKSSFSGNNGGNCVEVAQLEDAVEDHPRKVDHLDLIAVRDSKNPDGPKLFFVPAEWDAFLDGVKANVFDRS
jgi:hypothetical protein